MFISATSTKALPGLCEHYRNNRDRNCRVDRGNTDVDATCIALRRYGQADSAALSGILLSRLLSVTQRRAKYSNSTDTTNRILTRGLYFRSELLTVLTHLLHCVYVERSC